MTPHDCIAQWFRIYRKAAEPVDIYFTILQNGKTELIRFPHEQADGAGALYSLAKTHGWQLETVQTTRPPVFLLKYFLNCILFLYWARSRPKNIWPFKLSKCADDNTLYAGHCFSEAETAALLQQCREINISLNTFLFYRLNRALEKNFEFSSALRAWWIPVNMRADLGVTSIETKNYVSNFTIDVSTDMSLQQYQQKMTAALKQQRHWGTWWWQQLGRFVPEKAIQHIALNGLTGTSYAGTFSNLGTWTCSESSANLNFFVNPLLSHPVGASAIIWNGRLNVGLRIYPGFPLNQLQLENLVQEWTI